MNDFIAIDFETAEYSAESAISVGLVKYRSWRPVGSYYSLIRPPGLYIRPDFTDIHGLTEDDVKDAPDFRYLWENELRGFFGETPLVAHNAVFDMRVLGAVLAHYNIPAPPFSYFCSLALSRRVWPALSSHALSALAKEHNIVYDAHNALADADTCARIISLCAETVSSSTDRKKSSAKESFALADMLKGAGLEMKEFTALY